MKLQIFLADTAESRAAMAADDALLRLLARGRVQWLATVWEAYLCQQFGIAKQQDWPLAALARLGERLPVEGAYWMLASPVHLMLQRDSFSLAQPAPLALGFEESEALRTSLNRHFAGEGLEFLPGAQGHWHLKLQSAPALSTTSISVAAGRDITPWLPQGVEAQHWRQLLNEMQMLLFGHEVNQAREARGELAVNSVWLHGGGVLPSQSKAAPCKVYSGDASLGGMAKLAGLQHAAIAGLQAVLHDSHAPAVLQSSYDELGAGWCELLWQALKARQIQQLDIYFPWSDRMLHLRLKPIDVYKFWRKPIALEKYF
ncbi:hypothetical protein [Methylobacillus sp. Pita1]|uniref:hypothetical protein n=1 Tax=Methylobacillus sp. Pita1 TaxID=3382642 RepID=UPI0038B5A3AA